MLKLYELRTKAYQTWESLCCSKGVYLGASEGIDLSTKEAERLPWTNAYFKAQMREHYGDLRCRQTWESAAIDLTAHMMVQSHLEPYQIVGFMASPTYIKSPIRQHYGDRVIDVMLQFSEISGIIRAGLEQCYRESASPQERAIAESFLVSVSPRMELVPSRAI